MLHRITDRAVKCGPSAVSAIAGVPTHVAADVIRSLTGRKAVNGVFMHELAAALVELGWQPDRAVRRPGRRGAGREPVFPDVPFERRAVILSAFLDGRPPGTWTIHADDHFVAWSDGLVADSGAWLSRRPVPWSRDDPAHARVALRRVQTAVRFVRAAAHEPVSCPQPGE